MDLRELVNNPNANLIDVRSEFEFQMGNVEGSVCIPLDQVPESVERFKAMEGPVLLFCASGNRSGQAAAFLRAQGVEEAYNVGSWYDIQYLKANAA
jgi:phage shock protein E